MAQTTILSDDFDEIIWNPTPTTLTGREAPTGQTWVDFDHWAAGSSLRFGPGFGTVDNGAGGGDNQGNSIPLGVTLTTGTVHLGLDLVVNDYRVPQIWFVNDVTRRGFSYQWDSHATGSPLKFEFAGNIKNPDGGFVNQSVPTGMTPGSGALHVDLDIDLDANTLDVRWNDVNGPTSGSQSLGTWKEDEVIVEPNRLHLYQNTQCCGSNGYDNVLVDIGGVFVPPTEFTWGGGAGGNWNLNTNWTPGGIPGDGPNGLSSDKKVIFGSSISSTSTVFTDSPRTVNSIQFNHADSYIIGGGGGVNLVASDTAVLPTIDVDSGSHEFQSAVTLLDNTTVNVAGGSTLTINNALDLQGNTLAKTGGGELAINNKLTKGTGGGVDLQQGTISGSGTIDGSVTNSGGTAAPGNSPGALTIDGHYNQASGGTLAIEIGGTQAAADHDVLNVLGDASLAGILHVTLLDGFTPSGGEAFKVLTASGELTDAGLTLGGPHAGSFSMNIDATNDWIMLMTAGGAGGVPGDYNGNGTVDAADYTIFRDNLGGDSAVLGGNGSGSSTVVQADYDLWKQNFGSSGTGTGSTAAVPEPTTVALIVVALAGLFATGRRR